MRDKITLRTVEAAKPGERDQFIWDTEKRGFGLKVTPKGKKVYILQYRAEGKVRRFTIGPHGSPWTPEKARKEADKLLGEVAHDKDPAKAKAERRARAKGKGSGETVAANVAEFKEHHVKKKRPRTQKEMERPFDRWVLPRWRDRKLADITRRDIKALLRDIEDQSGPVARNRALGVLRTFFNWCLEEDILDQSPCAAIKRLAEETRERVLTDDEVKALWPAWEGMGYPFGDFFKLLLVTGQRRNEVAQMRWSDLDLEEKVWTVPGEVTKSGRSHEVPLSPLAVEIIEALPRFEGEYAFTTTSGKRPISGFSRAKARADKIANDIEEEAGRHKVAHWRLHDLRRTSGTNLAKLGIARQTISRVLNHAEGGVTDIYDRHSYLPEKQRALHTWAQKIESLIRPVPDKVIPLHVGT